MASAFAAKSAQRSSERDELVSLAWHIAKLTRAEKIPELKTLLSAGKPSPPQTPEQQFAIFSAMAAQSQRTH